jgi:hypothetical protein
LKEKKDDIERLLAEAGLRLPRVVKEIHKGLTQKKVIVYRGSIVRDKKGI